MNVVVQPQNKEVNCLILGKVVPSNEAKKHWSMAPEAERCKKCGHACTKLN